MNRINIEKIKKLSSEIKSSLKELRRIATLSEKEFLTNSDKIGSSKYNLIVAIQAAIDICNHLVAKEGTRVPEDYVDCFKILGEMGIIEQNFAKRLATMVKFRNLLIHLYWNIDNSKVYKILQENLSDFEEFLKKIRNHIAQGAKQK